MKTEARGAPRILLLVEDRDLDALLREFLPRQGFKVLSTECLDEARDLAMVGEVEAIIAECGSRAARHDYLARAQIPVLGIMEMDERPEPLPEGCCHALAKPVRMRVIVDALRGLFCGTRPAIS